MVAPSLATVTQFSSFMNVQVGLMLGIFGGTIWYFTVDLIRSKFKINDNLNVLSVHCIGGILGTLMVFFALESFSSAGLLDNILVKSQSQLNCSVLF